MPLNGPGMKSALQSGFSAGYTSYAAAGNGWGNAVQTGTASIVPPSTTVAAAVATLKTALTSAFAAPNSIPAMTTAFTAFATTVAAGMLPTYTGVPPAAPINFASVFGSTYTNHSDPAQAISDLIVNWLKTGTATLVAPPNTVIPWS